jgi:glycosyltransferase involved in cell wall biosynthesis
MEAPPRICVVVPVYNHALTVRRVVLEAQARLPVIVVDDGSTDDTPTVLAAQNGFQLITLPRNRGKAAALRAGFEKALALGFTHAITLDADGQHPTAALGEFVSACRRRPDALIIGVRAMRNAGAPWARRLGNALSNFCFRWETGIPLGDTQCGYRCYPLGALRVLQARSDRYAYELEVLLAAAWAGIPFVPAPVDVDYTAPSSRLSHFRPWWDLASIAGLHCRALARAFWLGCWRRDGRRPGPGSDAAPRP